MKQLALLIEKHRIAKGWSPEQLGAAVGVSGMTIRRLENPDNKISPHARTAMLLAKELDLDPKEILSARRESRVKAIR